MVIVISIKQISKDKPALELLCGDLTNDFTEDLPHALEFDVQQRLFPNFTFNHLTQGTLALVKTRTMHMAYMQR